MAVTEIREKASNASALSIDLHNLASSAARVGVQSAVVDNTTIKAHTIILHVKVRLGTSPTGNKAVYIYLFRSDGVIRDDVAAATKGALTQLNASQVMVLRTGESPSSNDFLQKTVRIPNIGGEWGVIMWHDTGVNTNTTAGDSVIEYQALVGEIQA